MLDYAETISRYYVFNCDGHSVLGDGWDPKECEGQNSVVAGTMTEARKELSGWGWGTVRRDRKTKDLCVGCLRRLEDPDDQTS